MKDRRWRQKNGRESEFGRMSVEEVEKIKVRVVRARCPLACCKFAHSSHVSILQSINLAFWELYINVRPPEDVLTKKRLQYERKTEHNKNSRPSKKVKVEAPENPAAATADQDDDGAEEDAAEDVPLEQGVVSL